MKEWSGVFDDEEENVIETVETIRNSPFIPKEIPIHGVMIDIVTGEVEVIVDDR